MFMLVCSTITPSYLLFLSMNINLFSVVQYSPTISTSPSPPNSPGKDNLNNASLMSGSDDPQVIGLNDGVIVSGGNSNNRTKGRGGRGGRGRGSTRGRRSTSAPPPEVDHNLDVSTISSLQIKHCS